MPHDLDYDRKKSAVFRGSALELLVVPKVPYIKRTLENTHVRRGGWLTLPFVHAALGLSLY